MGKRNSSRSKSLGGALSGSDSELGGKKPKGMQSSESVNSLGVMDISNANVDLLSDTEATTSASTRAAEPKGEKSASELKGPEKSDPSRLERMKMIKNEIVTAVTGQKVPPMMIKKVMTGMADIEFLLMELIEENARLSGRVVALDEVLKRPSVFKVPELPSGSQGSGTGFAPAPVPEPPAKKPLETWSLVVRSKSGGTAKEVADKVVKEVAPSLGVRVHEVRALKNEVVIRTPSVAELQKIKENKKFVEVGLEVAERKKPGTKVVIQRVHSEISHDEFMSELYEMNLKDKMTLEAFKSNVTSVTRPWERNTGDISVILEGRGPAADVLGDMQRCYIKWFSFHVKEHTRSYGCYKCLSFDHSIRDCKAAARVCHQCGQAGHLAARCSNAPSCRNCAFKGKPSGHRMVSDACPMYRAVVARVEARH